MRVVLVSGTNHKGSTYHVARQLADMLLAEGATPDGIPAGSAGATAGSAGATAGSAGATAGSADSGSDAASPAAGDLQEIFLPRDFGDFCTGCATCLHKSERLCPHHGAIGPLVEALDQADVVILASPTYVYHVTGAMKTFLDHQAYRWMLHRPAAHMFRTQVVCVTTAAGGGTRGPLRDMSDSAFYWGAAKIHRLAFVVRASRWSQVTPERREKIDRKVAATARSVRANYVRQRRTGRAHPVLRTRAYFFLSLWLHKLPAWPKVDADYFAAQGWSRSNPPWK